MTPQATVESSSTVVLVAHVLEGGWITILPEDIAAFLSEGKPLRMIPLDGAGTSHSVGLVAPWREPHTPVLEALLSEARRMARDRLFLSTDETAILISDHTGCLDSA